MNGNSRYHQISEHKTYSYEETLELRKAGAISDSILIFAMESTDEGRITIDLVNGKIYLYPIVGMQDVIFNFGEPRLVANSIDDFFDNLVVLDGHKAIPAIEEIEEGQTETAGECLNFRTVRLR